MVGKDCSIGQIGWLGCGMVTVFANVQVAALEFFFFMHVYQVVEALCFVLYSLKYRSIPCYNCFNYIIF